MCGGLGGKAIDGERERERREDIDAVVKQKSADRFSFFLLHPSFLSSLPPPDLALCSRRVTVVRQQCRAESQCRRQERSMALRCELREARGGETKGVHLALYISQVYVG
jgi:hypothetical protein